MHVVVVSNVSWTSWYDLNTALKLDPTASSALATSLTASPTTLASFTTFQNLTHFAVVQRFWPYISKIEKVAKKLRYFVILSQPSSHNHPSIIKGVWSLNDRCVVVVNMENFPDWPQGDSWYVTTFWETVESLVLTGFMSDQGHRWPMEYKKAWQHCGGMVAHLRHGLASGRCNVIQNQTIIE